MKGAVENMSSDNTSPRYADTALVLAAHGSRRRPEANALIDAHAAEIDYRHLFASVHTVFLMGGPDPQDVIQNISARRIIIVPFMMSDGYLVDVITERLRSVVSADNNQSIDVSDPIGTHSEIAAITADIAENLLDRSSILAKNATLVLVAHGAKERPESKAGAMLHLRAIEEMGRFAAVHVALLEEPPFIDDIINMVSGPSVIVGLFAAPGGHAIDDVQTAIAKSNRKDMLNAGPIGTDIRMIDLAIDRAISKIS